MKAYGWIPETRRQFIRQKRREIKAARKILGELGRGCAMTKIYDGTLDFKCAVNSMEKALAEMDRITKPLR